MTAKPTDREARALVRAFERRFGPIVVPYRFEAGQVSDAYGQYWRVTDVGTGSWIEGTFEQGRLTVRKRHNARLRAAIEAKYP